MPCLLSFFTTAYICHWDTPHKKKKSFLNQIPKKNELRKAEMFFIDKDNLTDLVIYKGYEISILKLKAYDTFSKM